MNLNDELPGDEQPGDGPMFSHLDQHGRARMVDVGAKATTHRRAVARGVVRMQPQTTAAIAHGTVAKGDVLAVARVAAIMAAKRTSELIPLCHPLMLSAVSVNFEVGESQIDIEVEVECVERTGVEMEALTACTVAALTIYDMCKSADRSMVIDQVTLWEKHGGRSGHYRRTADAADSMTNVVDS